MQKPHLPDNVNWPKITLEWHEYWRASTITDTWDERQWQFLFDTALVHANIWGKGAVSLMGELRQRLAFMGLAFASTTPEPAPDEKKRTPLDDLREKYSGVAGTKGKARAKTKR